MGKGYKTEITGTGNLHWKDSIGRKLTVVFAVCILSFGLLACLEGLRGNYRREQKENQVYLLRCGLLASEVFREYDVMELISDSKSSKYEDCQKEIDRLRQDMGLKYAYTYVPAEDGRSFTVILVSGMVAEDEWKPGQIVEEELSSVVLDVYEGRKESGFHISNNQYGYVVTVYCPVYDSKGKIQAVTGMDLERSEIVSEFFREIRGVFTWILVGCVVVFLLIRILSGRFVIRPVAELSEHMEHFVRDREEGRAFTQIEVKTKDEIGHMTSVFNQMAKDLEYYIARTADMAAAAERKKAEMEAARRIQKASLPKGEDPYKEDGRFTLYASMQAARQVGGDFYDFFWVSKNRLATVIGDVSGKGITAALFMMRAMTLIRERMLEGKELSEVLAQANDELCDRNTEGMFVTVFVGVLDVDSGRYRYAGAGHNPPYICREEFEVLPVERAVPLGLFEEEEYGEDEIGLRSGESIFLYTDGVTEAMNEEKELWGEARMRDVLNQCRELTCGELVLSIGNAVSKFAGEGEQSDDITMLLLRYRGETE